MSMILALMLVCPLLQVDETLAPTAAQVLERAASFQRDATPLGRPGSFSGRFFLNATKPDGTGTVSLNVERQYVREPERMLTRREETSLTGLDTDVAYDQGQMWIRDRHTGQVDVLNDDPETFVHEMAQIREQLRLSRLLLDVVTVDGLRARMSEVRWIGTASIDLGKRGRPQEQREVDLVVGRLPDELFAADPAAPPPLPGDPLPELQVELAVGRQDGALYRVHLTTIGRSQPETFVVRMKYHAANRDGLRVPANLLVLDGDGVQLASIGALSDDEGYLEFRLDGPIEPARFAVPGAAPATGEAGATPPIGSDDG